jgi:predicted transcriptional regulator
MTARQLSEKIHCMRSSVCNALLKLSKANLISDKDSIFDDLTERTVTLYSKVQVP